MMLDRDWVDSCCFWSLSHTFDSLPSGQALAWQDQVFVSLRPFYFHLPSFRKQHGNHISILVHTKQKWYLLSSLVVLATFSYALTRQWQRCFTPTKSAALRLCEGTYYTSQLFLPQLCSSKCFHIQCGNYYNNLYHSDKKIFRFAVQLGPRKAIVLQNTMHIGCWEF